MTLDILSPLLIAPPFVLAATAGPIDNRNATGLASGNRTATGIANATRTTTGRENVTAVAGRAPNV